MNFFFTKRPKSGPAIIDAVLASAERLDVPAESDINAEVAAAIGLALHLYVKEMREYENAVVTIQKVIKPYSPWSSKIYGLRQQPAYIPGLRSRIK